MSFKSWLAYVGLYTGGAIGIALLILLVVITNGWFLIAVPFALAIWGYVMYEFDDEVMEEINNWRQKKREGKKHGQ